VTSYTQEVAGTTGGASLLEPLKVFWSKVVDYPSYGSNTAHIRNGYYQWDETSGTVLMNGIVKKSWTQSSPWIGLAIIALVVSWFVRRVKSSDGIQEIRVLGLIVVPTLLMFSAAGFDRTDGLSFNQRYFLELLPLCAIALGLYLDRVKIDLVPVGLGFAFGGIIVAGTLLLPSSTLRHVGERFMPLLLALLLITAWYLLKNPRAIFLLLGMCIGWAFFFHIESDLVGSRFRRQINAARLDYLQKIVPDHSALFMYWGNKDAAGPIQLEKDVVILDVWADAGHDARLLEEELLAQGRRIFILDNDMPDEILRALIANRIFHEYSEGNLKLTEILVAKAPTGSN
jgi:hypothetical protein